jgi:predicted secreted hydrolase
VRSRAAWAIAAILLLQPSVLQNLPAQEPTGAFRIAQPGYHYQFPRDYFDHPEYQTEWWYYTGNVKSTSGKRFGFELTFFRQGVSRDPAKMGAWDLRDLYLAHLALSDLDGGLFYHKERTNRAGPGIAGVSESQQRIWNGNWQVQWRGGEQILQAIDDQFELHFTLTAEKPPVIHGENGVSQKARGLGRASHYFSLTRIAVQGEIVVGGDKVAVTGLAWMDHEFFTHQLESDQVGWDWFSVQLNDRTELMLFRIRRKDGSVDPYSAGTFVDMSGSGDHLSATEFSLQPVIAANQSASGDLTWTSPATHATYPIRWKISVPKYQIELTAATPLSSQELAGTGNATPSYWEGAIEITGAKRGTLITGVGYLEMTGYDRPLEAIP